MSTEPDAPRARFLADCERLWDTVAATDWSVAKLAYVVKHDGWMVDCLVQVKKTDTVEAEPDEPKRRRLPWWPW
jgi:hypothetical protein